MIRTGRRPRVFVSLPTKVKGDAARLPHIVRQVHESRRFLAITETRFDMNSDHGLDPEKKKKRHRTTTRFILENRILGPRKRRLFDDGFKNDNGYDTEIGDPWLSEPGPNTPEETEGAVKLRLRGGCLKLPERQGSKRRLGDEEELPTLVWWVAGGQLHQKPLNGRQLREWKRKSNGYDEGNKKRGWIREFVFAMSSGRVGRNSGKPQAEGSQAGGAQGDGDGGDGGTDA